jgi:hypothetical protein
MAASGDWIGVLLEFVLRAVFGVLKGQDLSWRQFGYIVAAIAIVLLICLLCQRILAQRQRREADKNDTSGRP